MSYVGDKRITSRQAIVASLLAEGRTQAYAARAVKVSPVAVSRWVKMPHFQAEVDRQRDQQRGRIQGLAHARAARTFKVLDEAYEATEDGTPEGLPAWNVRLRAIEATHDVFEKLSRKPEAAFGPGSSGPLIVLPGGAPMALLVGQPAQQPDAAAPPGDVVDAEPTPAPPALPAGTQAPSLQAAEPQDLTVPAAPEGLPSWWNSRPKSK